MNLNPFFALINASAEASQGLPQPMVMRPNSPSSATPDKATYMDLTPSHKLLPNPSINKYLTDVLEPMSMYGATPGIIDMWDCLLRDHTKEAGDCLHVTDYTVIEAVSLYLILHSNHITTDSKSFLIPITMPLQHL
jgi:hypothetical protein